VVLVEIGRRLFIAGLSMAVACAVLVALLRAAGIPLPAALGSEAGKSLSVAAVVSSLMALVSAVRTWGRLIPVDLMRGVFGVSASIMLSTVASTGLLVTVGILVDLASAGQPWPIASVLATAKAVASVLVPALISLYSVQRVLGVPLE